MVAGLVPGVTRVGLISDTHGWLDPRAVRALHAMGPLARIVHAGDIGTDAGVIYELLAIAPVTAVLGNCDYEVPGFDFGAQARVTVDGTTIVVVHDIYRLDRHPGDDVVVHGHSHRPRNEWRDGILYLNPGSATQRRGEPSCTVGVLELADGAEPAARIIELDDYGARVR